MEQPLSRVGGPAGSKTPNGSFLSRRNGGGGFHQFHDWLRMALAAAAADEVQMQSLRQRYRECAGLAVVRMNELPASSAA
jgi:hypothetical protein